MIKVIRSYAKIFLVCCFSFRRLQLRILRLASASWRLSSSTYVNINLPLVSVSILTYVQTMIADANVIVFCVNFSKTIADCIRSVMFLW